MNQPAGRRQGFRTTVDVALILAISLLAQATHFSAKQGRAVICGDSAQYVASAEALLDPDKTPHFEMRKPGYVFFLAGVQLLLGNMGWGAIAANHLLLAMLPLLAYAFGRQLRGRAVAWLAALIAVARLQEVGWGNRVMSEALFAGLFSLGMLLLIVGLSRPRVRGWMLSAGTLLGLAWLTRGSATPVIVAAVVVILVVMRRSWRRALASCVCFSLPIVGCIAFECSLNQVYAGQFRPSNGTAGAALLLRARHFEGFDLADTPEASRVLALLPERDRDSAYVADNLDVWVARHRAVYDLGIGEWEYDDLMGRVGARALADHLPAYLASSARMALCHLLRAGDGLDLSPVPSHRRAEPIHPSHASTIEPETNHGISNRPRDADWDATWFAYFGLPHLSAEDSMALVTKMKTAAATRAPFGGSRTLAAYRYWSTKPVIEWPRTALAWLGSLWPVLALVACGWLGLNRTCCALLASAYALEALFIGFITPTNDRLQFIWFVADAALSAGLTLGVLRAAYVLLPSRLTLRLSRSRPKTPRTNSLVGSWSDSPAQ